MSRASRLVVACGMAALLGGAVRLADAPLAANAGAAGTLPAAPASRYWAVADLQTRPQIKTRVMPEYPRDLVSGIRGRVVLDLYISAGGGVDTVRVVRAEPRGRFEQAAVKAFSGARFTPGIRKGKSVASVLRIEVTFGD